jgi:hypothetical protein
MEENINFQNNAGSNWRVPEIEHFGRGYNEGVRFYNCFPYQRKHGLKRVFPPKAEYLGQLQEEMRMYDLQNPNYLKNEKY